MGETDNNMREEIFSKAVRAGKRTYFFDVKSTKSGELYLTITESKRRFDQEQGKFFYEKHKLFLYKEDFEKFSDGYKEVVNFIETGEKPAEVEIEAPQAAAPITTTKETPADTNEFSNVSFEDLESETESKEA